MPERHLTSSPQTLAEVGLGGANIIIEFDSVDGLREAIAHLTTCHPHHFAVRRDGLLGGEGAVLCSSMAAVCLGDAGLL